MKEEFAGHLSRVMWDSTDLQLQTEVRYKPEARAVVIFVADGVVISRVEKAWQRATNSTAEHNNIRGFHERLTSALERLRDRAYIELEELKRVSVRLVSAAMHENTPKNRAEDALSLIPGSKWVIIANDENGVPESAPETELSKKWLQSMKGTIRLATRFSALLETGPLTDISLKTPEGFVLVGTGKTERLITMTEAEIMPVARQMVLRLQRTLLK